MASSSGDFTIVFGKGSQSSSRWGDFSSMSIDPVDGCSFWYTQEYIGAEASWMTRIAAFKFPSCHSVNVAGKGARSQAREQAHPRAKILPGFDRLAGSMKLRTCSAAAQIFRRATASKQ
jgi:hypothetical protein